MKSTKLFVSSIVLMAMVLVLSVQAQAELQVLGTDILGNQLIYDTDFDITWYDYSNTPDYWHNQVAWAAGLSVTFGSNTYDDWLLPTDLNQDGTGPCSSPLNCTGSEMGHLYYTELGNSAGGPMSKTGDFQHLLSAYYWTGTEYHRYTHLAWAFSTFNGSHNGYGKGNYNFYAIAVRPGLAVVPEPISSTLFIIGGALLGCRRFRDRGVK